MLLILLKSFCVLVCIGSMQVSRTVQQGFQFGVKQQHSNFSFFEGCGHRRSSVRVSIEIVSIENVIEFQNRHLFHVNKRYLLTGPGCIPCKAHARGTQMASQMYDKDRLWRTTRCKNQRIAC